MLYGNWVPDPVTTAHLAARQDALLEFVAQVGEPPTADIGNNIDVDDDADGYPA